MKKNSGKNPPSNIRIIAGQWRGRKLEVLNEPGLRPTGDRLRETLFNWLAPYVRGARCLDAFAGTGSLGLETLSRGASAVQFIEYNAKTAAKLQDNLALLKCSSGDVIHTNALNWLTQTDRGPFDIVFIDPPFTENLWQDTLNALADSTCLSDNCLIYVETPQNTLLSPPGNWLIYKQKSVGRICATLYRTTTIGQQPPARG